MSIATFILEILNINFINQKYHKSTRFILYMSI